MNNIKWLQENKKLAKVALKARKLDPKILDELLDLYTNLVKAKQEVEQLISEKKQITKEIPKTKDKNKLLKKIKNISKVIDKTSNILKDLELEYEQKSLIIPNLMVTEIDNIDLWQEDKIISKTKLNEQELKKPHWDIYEELGLASFELGVKVAGTRFITYLGKGAKLRRAIMNLQTDLAAKNDYIETIPPILAKHESLQNSGHFPKFKEDVFCIENWNLALVGSTETSICNFYANSIIQTSTLPKRYTATTMNFRSESGSAGKDTRGAVRMHQFTKTELFTFCKKEDEDKELKKMLEVATNLLKKLKLPFIVKQLAFNDLGFSAKITYDLEVWMPSSNDYREVSSISNVGSFQATRAKIRHRENNKEKTQVVSTLNGTSVAVDRLMAAICENNYNPKTKTITLPKALHSYFGSETIS